MKTGFSTVFPLPWLVLITKTSEWSGKNWTLGLCFSMGWILGSKNKHLNKNLPSVLGSPFCHWKRKTGSPQDKDCDSQNINFQVKSLSLIIHWPTRFMWMWLHGFDRIRPPYLLHSKRLFMESANKTKAALSRQLLCSFFQFPVSTQLCTSDNRRQALVRRFSLQAWGGFLVNPSLQNIFCFCIAPSCGNFEGLQNKCAYILAGDKIS